MSDEMLINVVEGAECRIAIVSDGVLEELYTERPSAVSQVGNIYKGRVTNVEPSIQAAFVDFGAPKNGFLHISDLLPQYFPPGQREAEVVGKKRARKDRPPIQKCLRRGQEVICQIIKEGIGTKGPTLTTYLSVPGRFLVMMPGMSRHGVSRKIEDEPQRQRLRRLLEEIQPPKDMGFIVRTAGIDRTKRDLQNDLSYLQRLWRSVQQRIKSGKAPAELYQESDLVTRTLRDVYSSQISRIVCDSQDVCRKIAEFLRVVMPRGKHDVKFYSGSTPLFHRYGLEREIEKIYSRRVELPGGASLVIDQTEALVAIDVNSGRYRQNNNAEETAYRTNLAAAKEVARQLRLRDMGGVIVIDFIDMRSDKHRRDVEGVLRDQMKNDRARSKALKISRLGLIEMTRQRVRPSLKHTNYRECPACKAAGLIKSDESIALSVMRSLQLACANERIATIELSVPPRVADYINNYRRGQLFRLERATGKTVQIRSDAALAGDDVVFQCTDARGSVVAWQPGDTEGPSGRNAPAPFTEAELVDVADLQEIAPTEGKFGDEEPSAESATLPATQTAPAGEEDEAACEKGEEPPAAQTKRRRRRRGGRKHRRRTAAAEAAAKIVPEAGEAGEPQLIEDAAGVESAPEPAEPSEPEKTEAPASTASASEPAEGQSETPKSTRSRRRRKKKVAEMPATGTGETPSEPAAKAETGPESAEQAATASQPTHGGPIAGTEAPKAKRSRRRRKKKAAGTAPAKTGEVEAADAEQTDASAPAAEPTPKPEPEPEPAEQAAPAPTEAPKAKRPRRRRKKAAVPTDAKPAEGASAETEPPEAAAPAKPQSAAKEAPSEPEPAAKKAKAARKTAKKKAATTKKATAKNKTRRTKKAASQPAPPAEPTAET